MDPVLHADQGDCAGGFRWAWCPILPAIGIALLAVFGLLYAFDYDLYLRILAWPIDGVFPYPFLDWIFVPAQIDCWRQGVDVYVATACDPLNRPMSYSPLWLRLTFIPTGKAAVAWTGLGLDVLFIAMLGFLPRPRRRLDFAIVALAVFSSATILALERANADLVSFAVAVFAGMCLERRLAARVIGYCAILLAGLLKFYPLVMLILLARERVARCIALGLAAVALLGGLAFAYRNELARMLPNVPHWNYFEPDIWGSMRLPGGSVTVLRAIGFPEAWVGEPGWAHPVCWIIGGALGLATVSVAVWLARSGSIRAALEALPVRHANFLVLGSAVTCGCFFAGQSIRYRAIMILLTLPGLLAMARDRRSSRGRMAFGTAVGCLLVVVWEPFLVRLGGETVGYSRPPITWGPNLGYPFWLMQELACWSLAAVLLAVVFWFIARSPICRHVVATMTQAKALMAVHDEGAGHETHLPRSDTISGVANTLLRQANPEPP